MATDICDKELGQLRKNRWEVAFSEQSPSSSSLPGLKFGEDMDRKATIVLEHLIQVGAAVSCVGYSVFFSVVTPAL